MSVAEKVIEIGINTTIIAVYCHFYISLPLLDIFKGNIHIYKENALLNKS